MAWKSGDLRLPRIGTKPPSPSYFDLEAISEYRDFGLCQNAPSDRKGICDPTWHNSNDYVIYDISIIKCFALNLTVACLLNASPCQTTRRRMTSTLKVLSPIQRTPPPTISASH